MEKLSCSRTRSDEQSGFLPSSSSKETIPAPTLGFFYLRLLSRSGVDESQQLIYLKSNRLYTIGRKRGHCQIVIDHCCVSRRHCQIILDGVDRRLRLVDGFFLSRVSNLGEAGRRLLLGREGLGFRVSLNGVFVNGRKLQKGTVAELSEGDEVTLGCGGHRSGPGCVVRYGFVVESIFHPYVTGILDNSKQLVTRAYLLQKLCRRVLRSGDPIKYLRRSVDLNVGKRSSLHGVRDHGLAALRPVLVPENCSKLNTKTANYSQNVTEVKNWALDDSANAETAPSSPMSLTSFEKISQHPHLNKGRNLKSYSSGKTFYLNRLEFMAHGTLHQNSEVTLKELLHPVESLLQVFIATFTCDISWFLSCCQIPRRLPVTVACHSAEKCWSSSCHNRTSAPYSDYPNLLLVYPQFPDEMAFGKDRSKKGVACHHPKLLILQWDEFVRVIITSANLVSKQWNQITNTVWWQDFPRRDDPDYSSLFGTIKGSKSDFVAQLAGFIASLVAGVPSQAHWIGDLTRYDFGGAAAHLIASIPGIYVPFSKDSRYECFRTLEGALSKPITTKYIGSVQASVVGLSHRFCNATDSSGVQLKKLASFLGKFQENSSGLLEVVLKRNHNIPADANAVSVHVANLSELSNGEDYVQLGFLPRDVAKWAAPLGDHGFLELSAFVCPKEALAAALDGKSTKVLCLISVVQGPKFCEISRLIQPEHLPALCLFIASIHRCLGLWRLQEVLSYHKWPESLETDFVYASSSIGTSMNPQFLAAFSSAAGKKSFQLSESEESDPEWGCWSTNHELRSPSIRILFPTIERVKTSISGIQSSRCLLSFSEKTWQRLSNRGIIHDAIPNPAYRIGYPMHVKVALRRFQSKRSGSAFGWIYCGSHNFSQAAWGRIVDRSSGRGSGAHDGVVSGARLHICNYELGVLIIIPPPDMESGPSGNTCNLDDITLPFVMPPPRYCVTDRPATVHAIREAMAECTTSGGLALAEQDAEESDEDIEDEEIVSQSENFSQEADKIYAEMLWSHVDSSGSF